jgi:flagellar biosynthesis chaperone FliJ
MQLQEVAQFRERCAERDLARQRQFLQEAEQALRQARQEAQQARRDSEAYERSVYGELCTRIVTLQDLDLAAHAVATSSAHAVSCEQRASDCGGQCDGARQQVEQAGTARMRAQQRREKFDGLADQVNQQEAEEAALQEARELEEFRTITPRPAP